MCRRNIDVVVFEAAPIIESDGARKMSSVRPTKSDEVEHLLRNAQLRDQLEPFFDGPLRRIEATG